LFLEGSFGECQEVRCPWDDGNEQRRAFRHDGDKLSGFPSAFDIGIRPVPMPEGARGREHF